MFSVLLQAVCLMTEGKCFAPFDSVWTVESGVSSSGYVSMQAGSSPMDVGCQSLVMRLFLTVWSEGACVR